MSIVTHFPDEPKIVRTVEAMLRHENEY